MASQLFSTFTEVGLVDTRVNAGTIQLPKTIDIPYRQISLKDIYGNFQNKSLTLTTQFPDTFEDGTTTKVLSNAFGFTTLYAGLTNVWYMTGGTTLTSQTVSSLTVSSISGSGALLTNLPAISSLSLQSTIAGLGIAGYISTSQLTSTVASLTYGYQTAGFVSTATIVSTTQGLQYAYQTAGFVSSPNLLNHVSTTFLNTSLTSTVAGLGQIYLSTAAAAITQANLNSTVQGLGSATYISSTQLLSTTRSYGTYFTTLSASFSTVYASSGYISSLRVDALQLGAGDGWADFGPLRATSISTLQVQTGALYTTSNFIGSVSSPFNAIQFYGLFGNYNNTVLAEVSTGVGTQELLLFKGSSTSDRIRLQTTGSIVFEPGSSARLWASSITSNVVPAMVIDTNSNVGIKTGTTAGIALDVAGFGRFQTVSTLNIQLSSINGLTFGGPINSTVIGLGSATYVSTTQLTSTVASLVYGYQAAGFISTATIVSTTSGLQYAYQTAGFVSSPNLLNNVSTTFLNTSLASTVQGLGNAGYISTASLVSTFSASGGLFASTVRGLGTAGYISTASLTSTVVGLGTTGYISTASLRSTIIGLGTAGYISTASLTSTVAALGTAASLLIPYSTLNTATYFQVKTSSTQLYYGKVGSTAQVYIGDLLSAYGNTVNTNPLLLIEQELPPPIATVVSFAYTGADQTWTVPSGVTSLNVSLTGAGSGGRGGFVSGTYAVTPGQSLTMVVGQAGTISNGGAGAAASYGGGGRGMTYADSGAGMTAIKIGSTLTVVAGGGGGTGYGPSTGGAGGGLIGADGAIFMPYGDPVRTSVKGLGGTQSAGGAGGTGNYNGVAGSAGVGGAGGSRGGSPERGYSGAGGGGYYGGGGGANMSGGDDACGGGGGGSSYVANLTGTVVNTQGGGAATYTNGSLSVAYTSAPIRPANILEIRNYNINKTIIDPFLNMGINVTSINSSFQLDVNGALRATTLSTQNIQLSSINGLTFGGPINSTVIGLGSSGYISSSQLLSTVAGSALATQATLNSTVQGLGTASYVSTAQLLSTTSGIYTYVTSFVDPTELTSTVVGLGTTGYVSSMGLLSTASGLASYITTFIDPVELASTVTGLGSASFVSTLQLTLNITSTVAGLGSIGYVSTTQLTSTVASVVYGYQTAGFVSTATIQSTTAGIQYAYQTAGFVSSPNLLNHVSTTFLNTSLASTVTSLQYAYQTAGFVSSPNLLNLVSTTALNTSLTSTVAGLGQIYLSTAAAAISQANLNSTVQGLGSATYISSTQLLSTTRSYANTFTSLSASFSSVTASNVFASTLIVNNLQIGTGLGWVNIGPIQTVALSTTQVQTGALYATSNFIGSVSSPFNAIQFYGLFGNYNNTVLAEVSTGVGTQELLLFKGSSTSDRIRLQTTGSIVFEPGSSARLWASSITSNVTPAMVIDTSSNVGIGTASPTYKLDVVGTTRSQIVVAQPSGTTSATSVSPLAVTNGNAYLSFSPQIEFQYNSGGFKHFMGSRHIDSAAGNFGNAIDFWLYSSAAGGSNASTTPGTGNINTLSVTAAGVGIFNNSPIFALDVASTVRFQGVSTLNIQLSSINGLTFGGPINSTVIGLGTTGYISTATLTSTVAGLLFTGSSISLSTASLFTSSVQASSISVGNGAWLSNTGLYLSNAQAGGAVGQLITNAGFVKLVAASGWSGGYTGFAITGGDLVNKIYMNAGPNAIGGQIAIGGSNPSPGSGSITLDVFGIARFSSISTFQTVASSIGIGIGQPLTPLDVAGMGRFQQLSTLLFNVSSINGFIPWQPSYLQSTVQGLGTAGYISTASLTSTVAALGTASALLVPYSSLNTATYFQLKTSSTQLYYGTVGSTAQVYIGDINSKYGNATLSTPTLLMEQFPIVIPSVASTIGVTYADVTYTVPAGVTSINVELNGAGGGGGSGSGTLSGGAGGRVTGTLAVTPGETLTVVVGIGGTRPTSYYSVVTGYGGGGSAGGISGVGDSGGGGGRSAIRRGGVDIVTAGGGGGAEGSRFYAGGLGGGTTGGSGGGFQDGQGLGGTQTAGGAGGQGANSSPGSLGIGGNASAYGAGFNGAGGGGGGYYGGGSGNSSGSQPGGGGGGSSYVALLTGTVVNTQGGGAAGGTTSIGSNGSVIISIPGYTQTTLGNIIEVRNYLQYKFIIDPSLNVGVNVSSINTNFKLDVNGAIRATSLSTQQIQASSITGISISTQNIQLSSINGLTFGGPIFSTVIGLGSAGYISTASLTSTVRGLGTAGYISTASLVSTFSASGGLFASTIIGLGTAGYISTASLVSTFSASGGLFASTVRGLGTAGYISTTSLTSTVAALGTASALLVPYSTLNTTTYFQIKNSTNQLLLGTNGPASQIYIGDVGATYGDSVSTYPTVLIEQTIYQQLNIGSSNYAYASGSDQYFTPPAGVTSVSVVLNGGGGASAPSYTGGSGGYVSGTFPVTPLTQYTIVIGQGGLTGTSGSWGGGGPAGGASSGGGGGRSAIILSGSDVVTAGGGGGAGAYAGNGGAGGGTTGASGGGTGGGGGGAQTFTPYPGNGGTNSGGGGSSGSGGAAFGSSSGGGGGGYFGGGGAGNQQGGGGGGSSYVANLTGTVVNTQGGGASAGNNGSINISWNFPLIYRNANPLEIRGWQGNKVQIDSYLNMSLSVSSPTSSFRLDVNGIGRMGMPVSSITGTVATFGTASYGIYYYISNSGFSNITLTSVTAFTGWFVTLRNNTTSYLSVAVTGQTNSTPATPFTIAPSNATTIAYDTNYNSGGTAGYAFF